MTHKSIVDACESLGMKVWRVPDTGRHSYRACYDVPGSIVYWSTSDLGGLLGLPRVIHSKGVDTHARSTKEIKYLVKL